ncbi:hypothetical protein HY643_03945 [Candidatus Woesearchaeota archaeon]|nr:hypothetical protein [Candidatus Woesearchaeota archaeon]
MGLEIFTKIEQPQQEKSLEVVTTEESVVDELLAYFEHDYPNEIPLHWPSQFERWVHHFENSKNCLQTVKITPKMIKQINDKLPKQKKHKKYFTEIRDSCYATSKGFFLSALIQTSYNQGFNGFKFEEIDADFFGHGLKGKENDSIKIKIQTLNGHHSFDEAEYCSLEAEIINGGHTFQYAKDCSLTAKSINGDSTFCNAEKSSLKISIIIGKLTLEKAQDCDAKIGTLEGLYTLTEAKNCTTHISVYENIGSYAGSKFGWGMDNCKIYSPNEKVLEEIKKQVWGREKNIFEIKK